MARMPPPSGGQTWRDGFRFTETQAVLTIAGFDDANPISPAPSEGSFTDSWQGTLLRT